MRGKPTLFSKDQGDSRAKTRRKKAAEAAFKDEGLPKEPPYELRGMPAAQAAWRRLIAAHEQLPAELFTGLDRGFLIGYCLAVQGRKTSLVLEKDIAAKYAKGTVELKDLVMVRVELRQSTRLVSDLEKQMFATPKARGGVTPPAKEESPEEVVARELAEFDKFLEDK